MALGRIMGVFYMDDCLIGSMEPEWIQRAINVPIGLFQRVKMMGNVLKSKTKTFHTGDIFTGIS